LYTRIGPRVAQKNAQAARLDRGTLHEGREKAKEGMSMRQMLLSINPKHVENIMSGKKRFEFRKVRCKASVDRMIIYATAPKKMVVAEAEIEDVIEGEINAVWQQTKDFAGITYDFFRDYYKDKKVAVAYKLRNVEVYEQPKKLSDYGIEYPPQSFVYVESATGALGSTKCKGPSEPPDEPEKA